MTNSSTTSVLRTPCCTPGEIAGLMPDRPFLASARHEWDDVTLQCYRILPSVIDFAPPCDHRLVLNLTGRALIEGTHNGHNRRWWFGSGCTDLTPANVPVTRSIKGRVEIVHIYLAPALVDEVAAEAYDADPAHVSVVAHVAIHDEALNGLGRLLLAEVESHAPGGRLLADMLTRALAVHMLRRYSSLARPGVDIPKNAMPSLRLRRAVEYMHSHLDEDLPLSKLAAVSGISLSRFARAFREATGEPPHRFLTKRRIEQACKLLEHTTLPIIEVGMRCGFSQPSHFATMFRQVTGISPRAYRQARRT